MCSKLHTSVLKTKSVQRWTLDILSEPQTGDVAEALRWRQGIIMTCRL